MEKLFLKNPHSVLAAIKNRPKDVLSVRVPENIEKNKDALDQDGWVQVLREARAAKISVSTAKKNQDPKRDANRGATSEAEIVGKEEIAEEDLLDLIQKAEGPGVWLALDCLQDPQNLGAIFRSAAFFGVKGLFFTKDRSASLTSIVYDISSGGVETVPYAISTNLVRTLEQAKERGAWVLGTSEHAKEPLRSVDRDRKWLVVVGNEESGLRRLTLDACDLMTQIPPKSKDGVTSLNVSVATGVILAHLAT